MARKQNQKGGGGGRGGAQAKSRGGKDSFRGRVDDDNSDEEEIDWNKNSSKSGGSRGSTGKSAKFGDDSEEEVFDLSGQHDDGMSDDEENSSGQDDDEEDEGDDVGDDDDEDEDEDAYGRTDLDQLIENLPSDIRQKVLRGSQQQEGDDDDDSDDEDEEVDQTLNGGWGKKSNYYSGDTADLEIGQDSADAEDEEIAVHELRKEQLSRRHEKDYLESSDDEEEEEETEASKLLTKQLEQRSQTKGGKIVVEKLDRDVTKLTKKQRMDILKAECPEMLGLVDELNEKLKDLRERIEPMKKTVQKLSAVTSVDDELVKYLEVKQQILLAYCVDIIFYLMLKAEGASVQSHPVMKQLLKLRYIMERMRHLDGKMKHQIDRLLSISDDMTQSASIPSTSRPNIAALLDAAGDEDNDDEDSDDDNKKKSKSGKYRVPKTHAVPYKDEKDIAQMEDKIKRKKNKIKNSEILDALREEFGHAPEESSSSGLGKISKEQQAIDEEMEERRKFEEDRFVRLTLTKKDKKAMKKRREMTFNPSQELVADMGDIDDLESLAALTSNLQSADPSSSKKSISNNSSMDRLKATGSLNSESLSNALKKAVNVFSQDETKKGRRGGGGDEEDFSAGLKKSSRVQQKQQQEEDDFGSDDYDNDDDGLGHIPDSVAKAMAAAAASSSSSSRGSTKRRRAPEMDNGDDDDDSSNLFNEFSKKKKEFLKLKEDHYTVEKRTGGHEDEHDLAPRNGHDENDESEEATKRAATYEIMTNRGLRPHRKKSNRNPRVKKREAFDKAVQKRKSQVREVQSGSTVAYGGEATGIKAHLSRSRRFGGVR